jgi:hypothetical protein
MIQKRRFAGCPQPLILYGKTGLQYRPAYALLARVYLTLSDYSNAKSYADSSLMLYTNLIDYNSIDTAVVNPFSANNEEVLYQSNLHSMASMFYPDNCYIGSVLYQSYSWRNLQGCLYQVLATQVY